MLGGWERAVLLVGGEVDDCWLGESRTLVVALLVGRKVDRRLGRMLGGGIATDQEGWERGLTKDALLVRREVVPLLIVGMEREAGILGGWERVALLVGKIGRGGRRLRCWLGESQTTVVPLLVGKDSNYYIL